MLGLAMGRKIQLYPTPSFSFHTSLSFPQKPFHVFCSLMAWRSGGSLSRSLMSAARAPTPRSSAPLPHLRPPPTSSRRFQSRRLSFGPSRNLRELGCTQSLLPLVASGHLTSRLNANLRAFCELSHGIGIGVDKEEEKMGDVDLLSAKGAELMPQLEVLEEPLD